MRLRLLTLNETNEVARVDDECLKHPLYDRIGKKLVKVTDTIKDTSINLTTLTVFFGEDMLRYMTDIANEVKPVLSQNEARFNSKEILTRKHDISLTVAFHLSGLHKYVTNNKSSNNTNLNFLNLLPFSIQQNVKNKIT